MDILGRAGFAVLTSLAVFASPMLASAGTFTADFSSPAQWDTTATSTALWDTVNQRISAAISANGVEIGFGDGSDGVFNDGPTQTGIAVSGANITITTSPTKSTFNFTSFNLSDGKTITVLGTEPLVIRVLGSVTIAGDIIANGANGTANSLAGPAPGGAGGPGAGAGGNAGTPAPVASTDGTPSTPNSNIDGGISGTNSVATNNGGGGGCFGFDGNAQDAVAAAVGGAAGDCNTATPAVDTRAAIAALFETNFSGGAGGGGGGAYTADPVSGSGGGGGGGAIQITSLGTISFGSTPLLGSLAAKGGNGGANNTPSGGTADCGGGGGGGSGGAIWLQAAAAIGSVADPGSADVSRGTGGIHDGAGCFGFADGGNGSSGILRLDTSSASLGGPTPTFVPAVRTNQTYVITSKKIDTSSSNSTFSAPTETLDTSSSGCGTTGTLSVTYAGSDDGVTYGTAVRKDEISLLNGKRYLRYTVTIQTTGSTPPCLSHLSIPYSPPTDFILKGGLACGTLATAHYGDGGSREKGPSPLYALSDLVLIGLAASAALLPLRRRNRCPYRRLSTR